MGDNNLLYLLLVYKPNRRKGFKTCKDRNSEYRLLANGDIFLQIRPFSFSQNSPYKNGFYTLGAQPFS